ncbi:MAG TPA: DegT/DnrJ/EryC1/StrS family aminotransferase [Candidatus Hydrogenedentes bacterium]|nr:DegT/DnrJ/EryC1/StrS family aminotransferase [Candidatus Hydrogenedentota bacterium]
MNPPNESKLAIDGGEPVAREPFPSGMLGPAAIGEEEVKAVASVVRSQRIFRFLDHENSHCTRLERLFAEMTGCPHALAVGGGTAALICGLIGIGVGEGDEVIVPGYTYIASASAILICNAVPVIAEIDESLTMDPDGIERLITPRTKAVMPVHMRGIPCDMDRIMAVAAKHGLRVIEDCAQACGGSYKGRRLGSIGHAGCFSLQQYKVITAGEGGMVVTRDRTIFERAAIRHDSAMCFWNPDETTSGPFPGENFRMNEMEGALGCVQFGRMEGILARTRELYKRIHAGIADCSGIQPHRTNDPEGDCGISVAVLLENGARAKWFAEALRAEGIPAGSMYDQGIPDRHIYRFWEYVMEKRSADAHGRPWTSPLHDGSRAYHPDMCPRTLDILGRTVIIGLSQTYGDQHADYIIEAIRKVAKG